jgi:hypothetical protein
MALRRIAGLMLSALLSMTGVIVMAAVADDAQANGLRENGVAFSSDGKLLVG